MSGKALEKKTKIARTASKTSKPRLPVVKLPLARLPVARLPVARLPVDYPPSTEQRWTFLTNHTHVLALIDSKPEILLREAARQVGITERAVQRIVQELEVAGYLTRERIGRRNRYSVVHQLPLRHPIEAHQTIGKLLRLVNSKGSRVT